jgi:DNA polymerase-3 subunit delta
MPEVSKNQITVLAGENWLGVKQTLDKLISKFVEEYGELSVEKIDAGEAELDSITGAITTQPFLIAKKLCVIYDLSKNKKAPEAIEQILSIKDSATDIAVVEGRLDKRSSYYKTLKKQPGFKEFNELDEQSTVRWLTEEAKDLGGTLSRADAQYLYSRVGGNQNRLSNELKKLINYDGSINKQAINELTEPTPSSSIFDLLNAAFSGNAKRAIAIYDDQRLQKVEPGQIIAMLGWQMHVVALVKSSEDTSPAELAKKASINPFVIQKSGNIASRLSITQIRRILAGLVRIDWSIKNKSIDGDDAIKNLLVAIAGAGR